MSATDNFEGSRVAWKLRHPDTSTSSKKIILVIYLLQHSLSLQNIINLVRKKFCILQLILINSQDTVFLNKF